MTPADLIERVRKLMPSGPGSFEGLVASCLEELTGRAFSLQRAGSQQGRDLTGDRSQTPRVFVECKRYGADTELDQRELLGETAQAVRDPDLDVWILVTSRPADDSLRNALRDHLGHFGVDFVAIALGDGTPSSLEVLLASSADSVGRFFSTGLPADHERCLEGIQTTAGFQAAKKRLLALVEREAGGFEAWKSRQRECLHDDLHDPIRSRARFRQRIDLDSGFVDRPRFITQLDEWSRGWGTSATPLVLVGEEGDGKTWLACSWADRRANSDTSFPAVLVVNGVALADRPLMEIVVDAATARPTALPEYGQATEDRFRRKVARWTSTARTGQPPLILLLDGVDDGPSPDILRVLLDQRRVDLPHIPLLMTVRHQFWEHYFRPNGDLAVRRLSIGPFDDDELGRALAMRGINSAHLAPELVPLLRKPRYLDLAARYQDRMLASGDLTVARLKFEDWKDRTSASRARSTMPPSRAFWFVSHGSLEPREAAPAERNSWMSYLHNESIRRSTISAPLVFSTGTTRDGSPCRRNDSRWPWGCCSRQRCVGRASTRPTHMTWPRDGSIRRMDEASLPQPPSRPP